MHVDKGKARICQGNIKYSMLAGVGLNWPCFVRDGHNFRHSVKGAGGANDNLIYCAAHEFPSHRHLIIRPSDAVSKKVLQ